MNMIKSLAKELLLGLMLLIPLMASCSAEPEIPKPVPLDRPDDGSGLMITPSGRIGVEIAPGVGIDMSTGEMSYGISL